MSYTEPTSIKSVATIAAWCDCPNHLATPSADYYLENEEHRQLCSVVAEYWDPGRCSRSSSVSFIGHNRQQPATGILLQHQQAL